MKRSPAASSCASSSSSSSSCVVSDASHHRQSPPEKPKSKRNKKNHTVHNKCQNANGPHTSARRSSIYRGVTRHRWTGRFEAHLWDKSSWNNIQNKKGKQVYLGAYDDEEAAAHTYDLAALKYWGTETTLNFPIETYTKEIEEMQKVSKGEYLASLRRQSSGFSRGVSKYRGVARHHHNGRWEARIGRVYGNKYLYLGTYNTQEEAAAAYDMAAIEYRGANAVTNFDASNYTERLKQKGIPIDHIPQDHLLNCSAESDEAEAEPEVEQPPQKQQKKEQDQDQQVQCAEPPSCVIDPTPPPPPPLALILMDPMEEHELTWNFCLDSGLASFPMPDLPVLENTYGLPDVGLEDDIDLIFESCSFGNEVNLESLLDNRGGCGVGEVGVGGSMGEENGKERLFPPTANSPSCSTTTTFCNYSV